MSSCSFANHRLWRVKDLLFVFVLGCAIAGWVVPSYAIGDQATQQRLSAKLESQEKIRVILTLNGESENQAGFEKGGSGEGLQQQQLQLRKNSFRNKHKASKQMRMMREFEYLPQMVYEVNKQGLQALLDDPDVTVQENRIARPSLAQSVARVYPTQASSPYNGNNEWAVAVVDTGVDKTLSTLSGKVISEACYSTTDISEPDPDLHVLSLCPGGASESTSSGSGLDCQVDGCGHGTNMAGIAVGKGSHTGVAKNGNIIAVKVFSQTSDFDICDTSPCAIAFDSDIIAGLQRVYELRNTHQIAAVNLSINFDVALDFGTCDGDTLKPVIDLLRNAGIVTVVSAGNDGSFDKLRSPACISTAFSVGATLDSSDALWPNTNREINIDLFAPGVDITTAFGTVSGTSAAAAHVSGAWVAIRHAAPTTGMKQLEILMQSKGPAVWLFKRRLDVTSILNSIDPGSQDGPPVDGLDNPVLAPIYLLLDD